jgi:hypothetical protein
MSPGLRSNCELHNCVPVATSTNSVPMRNEPPLCIILPVSTARTLSSRPTACGSTAGPCTEIPCSVRLREVSAPTLRLIDQAAGNSVAQVLILRVATDVLERKNCKRTDGLWQSLRANAASSICLTSWPQDDVSRSIYRADSSVPRSIRRTPNLRLTLSQLSQVVAACW